MLAESRAKLRDEEQTRLHRIRPFLLNISNAFQTNKHLLLKEDARGISFNVPMLFDLLDVNHDGFLAFDELNEIMKLNTTQLEQFIRRMNSLGEEHTDSPTVSRAIFEAHFLHVIHHSVNFDPSPDDILALFERIKTQQFGDDHKTRSDSKRRSNSMKNSLLRLASSSFRNPLKAGSSIADDVTSLIKLDVIRLDKLYDSELSFFLTDSQIYDIIQCLRNKLNTNIQGRNQNHGIEPQITSTDSDLEQGLRSSVGKSLRGFSSTINSVIMTADDKEDTLTKEDFVKYYAEALFFATEHRTTKKNQGIDVYFKDLSLHVQSGGKRIPVVNKVTGRIRRTEMTALMGGSGTGKTSLLNALCGRGTTMILYGYEYIFIAP